MGGRVVAVTESRPDEMFDEAGLAASDFAAVEGLLGEVSRVAAAVPPPTPSEELAGLIASPPVRRFARRRRAAAVVGGTVLAFGGVAGAAAAHVLPEPVQQFVSEFPSMFAGEEEPELPLVPAGTSEPAEIDPTLPDGSDLPTSGVTDAPTQEVPRSQPTTTPSATPPTPSSVPSSKPPTGDVPSGKPTDASSEPPAGQPDERPTEDIDVPTAPDGAPEPVPRDEAGGTEPPGAPRG